MICLGGYFRRILAISVVLSSLLPCANVDAKLTSFDQPIDPEFTSAGYSYILPENHIWPRIVFEEPGTVAFDLTVDSATVVTLTEDGNYAPPEHFPLKRPTGVSNWMPVEWLGFVATIETLELHEPVSSHPYILPTTAEVSNYFSQVSGLGTDRVRLFGGGVPADPTPKTSEDAAVLHWNISVSLPGAGKYRVRQWPSLTPIPEPSTIMLALAGLTLLAMRRR
jgi:PEP-CTERM motif